MGSGIRQSYLTNFHSSELEGRTQIPDLKVQLQESSRLAVLSYPSSHVEKLEIWNKPNKTIRDQNKKARTMGDYGSSFGGGGSRGSSESTHSILQGSSRLAVLLSFKPFGRKSGHRGVHNPDVIFPGYLGGRITIEGENLDVTMKDPPMIQLRTLPSD
ncbi:hypothetical protein RND71_019565 [Anisodus tanguticus]|uniref:Uncharacterized protein n=1 Tax=Anisodus tanguticus TaxID=243964 RepID=A0AAE1RZ83_9SOLA|nr:hypothetical protein RND71_019565 [Anisodus tanguticus]